MDKIDVVLVIMNVDALEATVKKLNLDRANLVAIVADSYSKKIFIAGKNKIPVTTFATLHVTMRSHKKIFWLIGGGTNSDRLLKIKNFLTAGGVPEDNIINIEAPAQISQTWLTNLRHIDEHSADFFVTGNEYTQVGVNLNLIPHMHEDNMMVRGGVCILADVHQTLRQSYLTAKHVFEHVAPGTIKFVLIGLMPHSLRYNKDTEFLYAAQSLQYAKAFDEPTARDELLMSLLSDDAKKIFAPDAAEQADLNFNGIKTAYADELSAKAIVDWKNTTKFFTPDDDDDNSQILADYAVLKDYIELCLANGAKPIGMIFPFVQAVRKKFDSKLLNAFRKMIRRLEENYDFTCVDMFELKIGYDCFFDMTHINAKGQVFASAMISLRLFSCGLLSAESFFDTDYEYLKRLALVAPKDEYNTLMAHIFDASAKRIADKKKIRVGFVMLEAAHWCGKDLYDFFNRDDRFEMTVFLSMDFHKDINDIIKKNFRDDAEQLRSHGLNVVALEDFDTEIPAQDVLIFLTPYLQYFAKPFQIQSMTPKTLLAYIPYAYDSSAHVKSFYSQMLVLVAWKIFFSSTITFDLYKKKTIIGMPAGVYSGYPRMDVFFKRDAQFSFDWKMARPGAKKIIWAPHHSIGTETSIIYATFQWNYKFMYEFAKTHPETSWVVKPHPWLLYTAVTEGVFASAEAFKEYLRAWNDLPNAQVVIGGYYQDIFATSDALIHDCGSFIAEYQYVDKPMIYLTRDLQHHNELGEKILSVSYCVDGQDLYAIAATLKRVIIDGDDYKAALRKGIFDKYLNYPKANGMLSSEFIYRYIIDKFKEVSE